MLISLLKSFVPPVSCSPLGQRHDSILFRQLLCPDPYCEVCNDVTAEMDQLLSSLVLEDAILSVSPLASAAPVTEPSFTQSPAFSAVPLGGLIPLHLPEPFQPPPSNLSPNTVTPLSHFPLPSSQIHSIPADNLSLLTSEFPVHTIHHVPPHGTKTMDAAVQSDASLTLNTIFVDSSITQDINPFPDLAQKGNSTESVTFHHVQPTLSVSPPPPHYSLTLTHPKPIHISSKPALENSSPDSTGALATYVPQGTDHPSLSISDFSSQKARVRDLLPSPLTHNFYQVQDVGYDSEKDLNTYIMSLSGANSMMSGQNVMQGEQENARKIHLRKKSKEISEGQLSVTMHSPWHAIQQTLSVKSHVEIKRRSLAPPVGREYCLNTCRELYFLESGSRQILEAHITKFHLRMMVCGLPAKVLESIKIFKLKDSSSHLLYDSKSFSTNLISEVVSKPGGFMSLQGSSKTLNHCSSATSLVGKEGQGILRQAPSEISHGLSDHVQRILDARPTPLPMTNIIGKASQEHSPRANILSLKLPIRQSWAEHELKDQSANSSNIKEMKKSEPVSMLNVSRAEELNALQYKMSDILTTSKLEVAQRINVSESKGVMIVKTENLPAKTSVRQDPNSADAKNQLIAELKKLGKMKHSQAQGQPTPVSHASDSLTYKASLIHAQGASSVDRAAPQLLHVHLVNRGVSMEQPQELWVPKKISRLCQDKNFPPATKKVRPTGSKPEELARGNVGLGTSQPGRKRFPTLNLPLKERLGAKYPKTPSQKVQPPPESLFRKQMNQFFQWLYFWKKCKQQKYSQEKGNNVSSTQSQGPVESRADTGNFLEEKLGHRHAVHITCPQEPLPSAMKFAKALQIAAVWAWAEPVQGHPFHSRASSCKVTNTKTFHQAAFSDKDRHPQKFVAFKDQLLDQKQLQSVSCSESVPHPSPTCRPPAAQWAPAALTTAITTVFRDPFLLLRQKRILDIFQGKDFPTTK
ncbi:spermatogenesis-associated protein 31D1-like [Myotis myotis]|uniref:spermatogenesis-associated protein 31D1-like n=1 Tax=Myotis myotis TaxID=51298 RepID=UPI001747FF1E|nr:spermatogenesis-associated protein 31D1-like [Myotis myotis]